MDAITWLTLALVVVTALYAIATFRILQANQAAVLAVQQQTAALLRPYVSVDVIARTGTTLLILVVRNTGKSAAEDLCMSLDRPLLQRLSSGKRDLRTLPLFSGTPTSLAAGAEVQHILGIGHELMNESGVHGMPESFAVEATYRSGTQTFSEKQTVDVRSLVHAAVVHDPVATAIDNLGKRIDKAIAAGAHESA